MDAPTSGPDLTAALLAPTVRARVVAEISLVLGLAPSVAERIVSSFERIVSQPLADNLRKLTGRDLAKRNPMIYTVRGTTDVDHWIGQVLADKETSAIEGQLGTWLEEVAGIVSGGIKPGNGVDLQIERDGIIQLYAIQASPSTKNSGSRRADIDSLKRAARPLRVARRHVELNIGVMHGQNRRGGVKAEPEIQIPASDEFWSDVSGVSDFRARLIRASPLLAELMRKQSAAEVERIRAEARALFDDGAGKLDVEAMTHLPTRVRISSDVQLELPIDAR